MDWVQIITNVISSSAIVTATYHIIKGLKTRLDSLQAVVLQQRDYIEEIRNDFKELSVIKSSFILDLKELHTSYKDHSEKTYCDIIAIKEAEIVMLKSNKPFKEFSQPKPNETTIKRSVAEKTNRIAL